TRAASFGLRPCTGDLPLAGWQTPRGGPWQPHRSLQGRHDQSLAALRIQRAPRRSAIARLEFRRDAARFRQLSTTHLVGYRITEGSRGTEQRHHREGHNDSILALKLSRDGKSVATAGADKLVKIWTLGDQKEKARFEGHTGHILAL